MFKQLLFSVFLLTLGIAVNLQAQEDESIYDSKIKKPTNRTERGLYLSLSGGLYFSTTQFELGDEVTSSLGINHWSATSSSSAHLGGTIQYFFTENIGVGLGANWASHNIELTIDEMNTTKNIDIEGYELKQVFSGENLKEGLYYYSANFHWTIQYKQAIGEYLSVYGSVGITITLISGRSYIVPYLSDLHSKLLLKTGNELEGFSPRNEEEVAFLVKNQLFNRGNLATNELRLWGSGMRTTTLGLMTTVNPRLRVKIGGNIGISGNILGEGGSTLLNPDDPVVTVERTPGSQVRNIYHPIMTRKGNQLNLFLVGIELGLVYKM